VSAVPDLSEVRLASIPRRATARAIDYAITFVPAIIVAVEVHGIGGFLLFFVVLLACASQDPIGTARWGKSIGKALLGIRVVDERTLRPPDLWHAFLRWWIPGLLPPLLVWATWDKRRQGIHDKAAETLVVRG
jgi:uncharacterized RDD family membrane protein YckC